MKWLIVLAACAFGAPAAPPPTACPGSLPSAQVAAIGAIARRAQAEQHISGLTIGVGRSGRLLFACGYGLRDRARGLPSDAATVYPLGSINKQFTAAAVMKLAAAGKVDIDASLARYLPDAPYARELRVRDLLQQTSGLTDYVDMLPDKEPASPRFALRTDQYARMIARKPLRFRPGTKYEYSNTNYMLLGVLVAKVSGRPYAAYLHASVLGPAGLSAMQYLSTLVPRGPDVAHGYAYEPRKKRFVALPDMPMAWANAAGSLAGSVADLIRWDGAFFGGKVVGMRDVRTMTTPPALAAPASKLPLLQGYAFGWVTGTGNGRRIVWHNGGVLGARAMNATFPATGLEVVVLTNVTTAQPEKIALAVARALGD